MKTKFTLIFTLVIQSLFSQGIIFNAEKYDNLPAYEPQKSQGFANAVLPSKLSYRSYCPAVLSQGQVSTCVGWATSYALLSTQQNILMGETNFYKKQVRVMDPNFVYALIRNYNDGWCQKGTFMGDAMDVLLNNGSKPLLTPPWLSCNSTYEFDKFAIAIASIYSINHYYTLNDKSDLINTLKYSLYNKQPIAVGMNVTKSFATGSGMQYGGKWSPSAYEQIEGGHAMCIVGYDDTKYGGSFELMNSYGTEFGDNGFVWISYADMKKYMQEAYIIELNTDTYGYRKGNCSLGDCYDYYSRYKYSNGEVYEGEFSKGYRNGWGMYSYNDNSFYIGNFSNGYMHGWGIYYNSTTGYYYKTNYNYGTLQSSQYYQGFSGTEEDKKLDGLIEVLQNSIPGKSIDVKSDAYQDFMESSKPEGEPIKAEPSSGNSNENKIDQKTNTIEIPSSSNVKEKQKKKKTKKNHK
jgi:hypothetical protein